MQLHLVEETLKRETDGQGLAIETAAVQGRFAGWALDAVRGLGQTMSETFGQARHTRRQMRLLETLPLGGKRQLMLVSCGSERYLVGGGPDSVATIVRVRGEAGEGMTKATPQRRASDQQGDFA